MLFGQSLSSPFFTGYNVMLPHLEIVFHLADDVIRLRASDAVLAPPRPARDCGPMKCSPTLGPEAARQSRSPRGGDLALGTRMRPSVVMKPTATATTTAVEARKKKGKKDDDDDDEDDYDDDDEDGKSMSPVGTN